MLVFKIKNIIMSKAKLEEVIDSKKFINPKIFKQTKSLKFLFLDVLISSFLQVLMMVLFAFMI